MGVFVSTSLLLFSKSQNVEEHLESIRELEVKGQYVEYNPVLRYEGEEQLLRGNRRALAAFGTLPERIRLSEVRRAILANQNRPPDASYNINVSLSDVTSVDRHIEDTRPPVCKTFTYDLSQMSQVSIVIPFYNEALSMLLRTLHSILNRTPSQLLREIILVDDASTYENLRGPLDRYAELLPKVRLLRNQVREGLIRSRLTGAQAAAAPLVVFLDAHTEMNAAWLEPIVLHLQKHPTR